MSFTTMIRFAFFAKSLKRIKQELQNDEYTTTRRFTTSNMGNR